MAGAIEGLNVSVGGDSRYIGRPGINLPSSDGSNYSESDLFKNLQSAFKLKGNYNANLLNSNSDAIRSFIAASVTDPSMLKRAQKALGKDNYDLLEDLIEGFGAPLKNRSIGDINLSSNFSTVSQKTIKKAQQMLANWQSSGDVGEGYGQFFLEAECEEEGP